MLFTAEKKRRSVSKSAFYSALVVLAFSIGAFIGKIFTDNQSKVGHLAVETSAPAPRQPTSTGIDPRIIELLSKQRDDILDLCKKISAESALNH